MSWGVLSWNDVGIVIRAVEGKREEMLADTVRAVETFAPNWAISYHAEGRTFAEAYTDAIGLWGDRFKWTLQLEDDVYLAPDFPDRALEALADPEVVNKAAFITFYNTYGNALEQMKDGFKVVPGPGNGPSGQAMCFRSSLIENHNAFVLDNIANNPDRKWDGTDTSTGDWLRQGYRWYATAPSIVQHIGNQHSLVGHSKNWNRMAPSYKEKYGEDRL